MGFAPNILEFQGLILIDDAGVFRWVSGCVELDWNMSDTETKDDTFGFDKVHEFLGFVNRITNPFSIDRAF